MLSDLRFALRSLGKSPGFAAIAVITLALGIGACTAIFSVINALLLRPLPFPDADQIVQVWSRLPGGRNLYATGPLYQAWRDENTTLDSVAAVLVQNRTLTGGGRTSERIRGLYVSADYLRVLRVHPLLGRDFAPDADKAGGANNVVILRLDVGMLAAVASGRLLAAFLFGVIPHDPVVYMTVALLVLTAAITACLLPARRATRVDPIVALRAE